MTKIICISGKAGSGKDTVAEMLCEELESIGYNVLITHYADILKLICRDYFDWSGEKDPTGRTLLQNVGGQIREIQPDYFVKAIADVITAFPDRWDYVLIPDTRYPNEIDYWWEDTDFQAYNVEVIRPDLESALTDTQQHHHSETALNDYESDVEITNDGTLDDLRMTVKKWAVYSLQNGVLEPLSVDADGMIYANHATGSYIKAIEPNECMRSRRAGF